MKKIYKNILGVILFIIVLILGGSIINDIVILIIKDRLSETWVLAIKWILTLIFVIAIFNSPVIKNLEENIFGRAQTKKNQ